MADAVVLGNFEYSNDSFDLNIGDSSSLNKYIYSKYKQPSYRLSDADKTLQDKNGYTAICYACSHGVAPEIIAYLIKSGFTTAICARGKSPAQLACESLAVDTLKVLCGEPYTYTQKIDSPNAKSLIDMLDDTGESVTSTIVITNNVHKLSGLDLYAAASIPVGYKLVEFIVNKLNQLLDIAMTDPTRTLFTSGEKSLYNDIRSYIIALNYRDKQYGYTPIMLAVSSQNYASVDALLETKSIDLSAKTEIPGIDEEDQLTASDIAEKNNDIGLQTKLANNPKIKYFGDNSDNNFDSHIPPLQCDSIINGTKPSLFSSLIDMGFYDISDRLFIHGCLSDIHIKWLASQGLSINVITEQSKLESLLNSVESVTPEARENILSNIIDLYLNSTVSNEEKLVIQKIIRATYTNYNKTQLKLVDSTADHTLISIISASSLSTLIEADCINSVMNLVYSLTADLSKVDNYTSAVNRIALEFSSYSDMLRYYIENDCINTFTKLASNKYLSNYWDRVNTYVIYNSRISHYIANYPYITISDDFCVTNNLYRILDSNYSIKHTLSKSALISLNSSSVATLNSVFKPGNYFHCLSKFDYVTSSVFYIIITNKLYNVINVIHKNNPYNNFERDKIIFEAKMGNLNANQLDESLRPNEEDLDPDLPDISEDAFNSIGSVSFITGTFPINDSLPEIPDSDQNGNYPSDKLEFGLKY